MTMDAAIELSHLSPASWMNPGADVTASMLLVVIDQDLDDEFNAHELVEAVRRRYPLEYREELIKNASASDPAKRTASVIASRLNHGACARLVTRVGAEWSLNPRGTTSRIALFRRR